MGQPTPGPLEVLSGDDTIIVASPTGDVAEFFFNEQHTVSPTRDEALANAHLFVAAEKMLEALKKFVNAANDIGESGVVRAWGLGRLHVAFVEARIAIAAAEIQP
jgi:hypothetical protein